MGVERHSGDPRVRVTGLVLLTWGHATASDTGILLLATITLAVIAWYREAFLRYLPVIQITVVFLCALALLAWLTTANISFRNLLLGVLKWLSMSAVSLTIFSSLNALEIIVALRWLGVPLRIALALGVSLRFFPVLVAQGSKILMIQRLRTFSGSSRRGRWQRLRGVLWGVIPAMLVAVLRQVENISLSILTQDIERRVLAYRLAPPSAQDLPTLLMLNVLPLLVVVWL